MAFCSRRMRCLGVVGLALLFVFEAVSAQEEDRMLHWFPERPWTITQINTNRANAWRFIEGDILPHVDQPGIARGGIAASAKRWPFNETTGFYEVPYVVSSVFTSDMVANYIRWGMDFLERGSSVRFVPKRPDQTNFINFVSKDGCFSYLGMQPAGGQDLSLDIGSKDRGSCVVKGTVVHELIHALGIGHEHQRPDRDKYIRVLWDNVVSTAKDQLQLLASLDSGKCSPYDYASIMHYDMRAFSVEPKNDKIMTLEVLDRVHGYLPLQAVKIAPSSCDWFEINTLYPRNGFDFMCIPHQMPLGCLPVEGCKAPQASFSCMEYCMYVCHASYCTLPSGGFPSVPQNSPKGKDVEDFQGCTNTSSGLIRNDLTRTSGDASSGKRGASLVRHYGLVMVASFSILSRW